MIKRKAPARRHARRANPKFYIFIAIVLVAVIAVVFFVNSTNTEPVEQGEILFEKALPVIVVRDEQVVSAQNYGDPKYLVQEGQRVEAETPVIKVYKWGYKDKVMTELLDIQTKIEEYQENALLGNEQLVAFNTQIAQKSLEIRNIINGQAEGNVVTAENELKSLMTQKSQFLRENVAADATLNDFYSKEQTLQSRVDEWSEDITAPAAGVVSFYLDGAEQTLNAGNITQITSAEIAGILNGGTESQVSSTNENEETSDKPLFRLVNNYKWYLAVNSDVEIPELAQGNVFSIAFDDYMDKQYQGTVVGTVKEEEGGYTYAIEIDDDIGQLINTRRTNAKVFASFQGLKVPEKAIQEKDGVTGVTVVAGNDKTFVPVDVKIVKDGSAIIVPAQEGSILAVNQHVEV
ncbi:MAG: HlyD family efflux transporter periplasmic adaptor subunit [Christensenella sp.]|nr:HlyD family efflux transporter periplasmic adaptor subunit [Christensenella sp.]